MHKRLLSYYGDDFTGSSDVMEAMASHGVRTVLFTRLPTPAEVAPFAGYEAIGLAGTSRSQSPAWMDEHLPPAFAWLKALGAAHCHYKVCSTFDSGPAVGSIGRAIDIGRVVFGQEIVPLIAGAPQLKRYTAFGHLFAAYQGAVFRIDRHPVMSRHPVTPMREADLVAHLGAQTRTPVALVGLDALARPNVDKDVDAIAAATKGIVLLDVCDAASQLAAGRQVRRLAASAGPFVAGSSGVEYALLRALEGEGRVSARANFAAVPALPQVLVLSGSCSPTTQRQIRHALAHGFGGIAAEPLALAALGSGEEPRVLAAALATLGTGRSPLIHTALGPGTDKGAELDATPGARQACGEALGRIARALMARTGLRRLILAGGDTSSHALGQLDIFALTTRFPLTATLGSPLCTAHSASASLNGIDLAMKGGQVGNDDYFTILRDGLPAI